MSVVYRYYPGYEKEQNKIRQQSLKEDYAVLDNLFGRGNLSSKPTFSEVKQEALRQLEIEYRDGVNDHATFWSDAIESEIYSHM